MGETETREVLAAHELLRAHYGEPVRPVSHYCNAFTTWANVIGKEGAGDDEGPRRFEDIAKLRGPLELAIRKSNLLYRLIYLGEPLRTEKCPEHDGHWSGYAWPGSECPHGCCSGYDITGWLPVVAVPSSEGGEDA